MCVSVCVCADRNLITYAELVKHRKQMTVFESENERMGDLSKYIKKNFTKSTAQESRIDIDRR